MNNELELYFHIPFCQRKCLYCDFLSFAPGEGIINRYMDSLFKEITFRGSQCANRIVTSVFIGGGTPSFIDPSFIKALLRLVRDSFLLSPDCEISI